MTDSSEPVVSIGKPVPRWHLHRRLYDWVLGWAETPYGGVALGLLAFGESFIFPVPPDVLLAPLVLGSRRKWFRFALVCSVCSLLGGAFGYLIGATVWPLIADTVFRLHIPGVTPENFERATEWFERWNFWIVFTFGFTFLPYKVCTISAGMFFGRSLGNFLIFLFASAVSRSARFFAVAGLFALFGPRIKPVIDKYFNLLCLLFVVLLIGGFVLLKYT